jgi:hypothetical protein
VRYLGGDELGMQTAVLSVVQRERPVALDELLEGT